MPVALRSIFVTLALTLAFLLAGELVLELRHYFKGYDTLLLGRKPTPDAAPAEAIAPTNGPTADFPFRSPIVDPNAQPETIRIWVASASYAAATDLPPAGSFANQLCDTFLEARGRPCQTLNNSAAAWTTLDNIEQLKQHGPTWKPDYAILYEMSNDIEYYSGKYLGASASPWNFDNGVFDAVRTALHSVAEQTSSYSHLRHYVGGSILLSSQLPDALPETAIAEFRAALLAFIDAARSVDALPVLATFVASHDTATAASMPVDYKFQILRYNGNLSPAGWLNAIDRLNEVIREVGKEQNVPVADLAATLERRPEYFKDFFHFTATGHKAVAAQLGKLLSEQTATFRHGE